MGLYWLAFLTIIRLVFLYLPSARRDLDHANITDPQLKKSAGEFAQTTSTRGVLMSSPAFNAVSLFEGSTGLEPFPTLLVFAISTGLVVGAYALPYSILNGRALLWLIGVTVGDVAFQLWAKPDLIDLIAARC